MPYCAQAAAVLFLGALVCAAPAVAQSSSEPPADEPQHVISARELGIPESARSNYAKSREELLERKDPECALTHLRKAIAAYPGYYEAHYLAGVALLELKQHQEAESALRKAVSLSAERFAPPLVALAAFYSDQQRFAEAEPLAAQAVELDDSAWYAHYELARARFALGRTAEALPAARAVAVEKPDYSRGRLLLALIHAERREYSDALQHLDACLRLNPLPSDHARLQSLREEWLRADDVHAAATAP